MKNDVIISHKYLAILISFVFICFVSSTVNSQDIPQYTVTYKSINNESPNLYELKLYRKGNMYRLENKKMKSLRNDTLIIEKEIQIINNKGKYIYISFDSELTKKREIFFLSKEEEEAILDEKMLSNYKFYRIKNIISDTTIMGLNAQRVNVKNNADDTVTTTYSFNNIEIGLNLFFESYHFMTNALYQITEENQNISVTYLLRNIEKSEVDEKLFSIDNSYKIITMDSMMNYIFRK